MSVRVIVLRAAGTNCDAETAYAFRLAGADAETIHINKLIRREVLLDNYQILVIPGGFTYGDDVAAGAVLANELRHRLRSPIDRFLSEGKLMMGICNGFQAMMRAGLVPGIGNSAWHQQATLTTNDSCRYEDRWVHLRVEPSSACPFTSDIEPLLYLPVAHGEGKFLPENEDLLTRMDEQGQIVLRYVNPVGEPAGYPWNPNGSVSGVAGVCDPTGRVFGMMPHPERHILPTHHPRWTREGLKDSPDGMILFRNAVRYARDNL